MYLRITNTPKGQYVAKQPEREKTFMSERLAMPVNMRLSILTLLRTSPYASQRLF